MSPMLDRLTYGGGKYPHRTVHLNVDVVVDAEDNIIGYPGHAIESGVSVERRNREEEVGWEIIRNSLLRVEREGMEIGRVEAAKSERSRRSLLWAAMMSICVIGWAFGPLVQRMVFGQ